MKEVTKELMQQIDKNNLSAKELLKGMIVLQDEEIEDVNLNVLAECALEYLEKNNKLIDSIM